MAENRSTLKYKEAVRILVTFQDTPMFSEGTKRSRRKLFIGLAEHRSILKNKGEVRMLVIFQDRSMFRHIIQNVSGRTIE